MFGADLTLHQDRTIRTSASDGLARLFMQSAAADHEMAPLNELWSNLAQCLRDLGDVGQAA